jgi:hypothetical protein
MVAWAVQVASEFLPVAGSPVTEMLEAAVSADWAEKLLSLR